MLFPTFLKILSKIFFRVFIYANFNRNIFLKNHNSKTTAPIFKNFNFLERVFLGDNYKNGIRLNRGKKERIFRVRRILLHPWYYLIQAEHKKIYLSSPTNILIHNDPHWYKRYLYYVFNSIDQLHKKASKPAHNLGPRTLTVFRREVENLAMAMSRQLNDGVLPSLGTCLRPHLQNNHKAKMPQRISLRKETPNTTRRQMTKMVIFSKSMDDLSVTRWKKLLWRDEAIFNLSSNR